MRTEWAEHVKKPEQRDGESVYAADGSLIVGKVDNEEEMENIDEWSDEEDEDGNKIKKKDTAKDHAKTERGKGKMVRTRFAAKTSDAKDKDKDKDKTNKSTSDGKPASPTETQKA